MSAGFRSSKSTDLLAEPRRSVARESVARAFTLIETLLALALVGLLSGSIFGFVAALSERRKDLDRMAHREEGVSVLCEQLEAGLLCALAGDKAIGAGVKGDAGSIRIISRGVRLPTGKDAAKPASDLVASEFSFDAGAGVVRAKRWEIGRSEPEAEVLVGHVKQLKLRYRDGGEWVEAFDSVARNGLPSAIEVSLWFGEPAPADDEHKTVPKPASDPASTPPPDRIRVIALADSSVASAKEGAR
jgi:prepilin-type N-terminal cleavage/methylation domain-containing protein